MNTLAATLALILLPATALAGTLDVSDSTLDSMGLSAMQQMSDQDGLGVRGKGLFDGLLGALFPDLSSFEPPTSTDPPASNPPQSGFDSSPFDHSVFDHSVFSSTPFGDKSMLGNFSGGSQHFGSGPSIGNNSFGFTPFGP